MDLIKSYFPTLTDEQYQQFEQLTPLYREWNEKINVVSRKDIDALELQTPAAKQAASNEAALYSGCFSCGAMSESQKTEYAYGPSHPLFRWER